MKSCEHQEVFALTDEVMDLHHFKLHCVINVGGTEIAIVQTKPSKVLALKGKKRVESITSSEKGVLCTAVICMSAEGGHIPPCLIFSQPVMKQELLDGTPPGTCHWCYPSGWAYQDVFTSSFEHFLSCVKPNKEDNSLLGWSLVI